MDVDVVVGRDAYEVLVEGAVVDRAQAQPVGDDGLPGRIGVPENVRRVEQACLLEPADCTLVAVRGEHPSTEAGLVKAHARLPNGVAALDQQLSV